jgi:integrase
MALKFTQKFVEETPPPSAGRSQIIHYDTEVKGFGVRVTKAGARSFVLNYRTRTGLEHRLTIGAVKDWPVKLAREEARRLRRLIDQGGDPLAEREARRVAPSVAGLVERWRADAAPKKRPRSQQEDEGLIRQWILPELGARKVADIKRADIQKLHTKITKAGAAVRANRVLALASRLFNLAIGWEMRRPDNDNPASMIARNPETARYRYLEAGDMGRLLAALPAMRNQQAADVIRVLLLTGARRGEVLAMRWDQLDLLGGHWTKPAAATKQKRLHRVPLSGPARPMLADINSEAAAKAERAGRPMSEWVFPAPPARGPKIADRRRGDRPISDLKTSWQTVLRAAQITDLHVHDLRHCYASYLASSGSNLPLIGQLLGHTQAATTQRYAHLLDDPQRAATERVAGILSAIETGKEGEVVPLRRPRRL